MRIAVHDYGGYPFPPELSRWLAERGHEVLHLYCEEVSTGKGRLQRSADDPPTLRIEAVSLGEPMQKYSAVHRFRLEWKYGGLLTRRLKRFEPDVLLTANTPLVSQLRTMLGVPRRIRFVIWLQDLVSVAMADVVAARVPALGGVARLVLPRLEGCLTRRADHTIAITPGFAGVLEAWRVDRNRVTVIPNWAPLDELPERPRLNSWRANQAFAGQTVLLYSGTLGLKHNPNHLAELAQNLQGEAAVVVISEGPGADTLRARRDLPNLHVLDYQPYETLPDVLAAADVLVAILEKEAGAFSVPSKVLTYLCAARPVLAALPPDNLAARLLTEESRAGLVVAPDDTPALVRAARALLRDVALREQLGRSAREYAERTFDIAAIGARFEKVVAPSARSR